MLGGIAAALAILGAVWRSTRRLFRFGRKLSLWLDQVVGGPGHPSLIERVTDMQARTGAIEDRIAGLPVQHQQWHAGMARHAVNGADSRG